METAAVVEYTCQHCERVFTRRANQRGRKPKFCGGKCRNLAYEARLRLRLNH